MQQYAIGQIIQVSSYSFVNCTALWAVRYKLKTIFSLCKKKISLLSMICSDFVLVVFRVKDDELAAANV